jgi:hypothetical protein
MGIGVTYSFKDLTGVLTNPAFGVTIPLSGGDIGFAQMTVTMATERTVHDVAADGTVMVSYVAGDNGAADLEVQQTSSLHHQLLGLYNLAVARAEANDVSGWASTVMTFRTILDGAVHILTGVSFGKLGDKPYAAAGGRVRWALMVANSINI